MKSYGHFARAAAMIILFLWISISCTAIDLEPARVIRVISGDTLTIQYKGKWEEIKLLGIETPETTLNNKVYEKALENAATPEQIIRQGNRCLRFLKRHIRYGSQIWLEFDLEKRDRVQRLLAYVYLPNGRMLNEIMLQEGYANLANYAPNFKYQSRFQEAFRQAKIGKRGLWNPPEADIRSK